MTFARQTTVSGLASAALAALALLAAAPADGSWTVEGRGFGHGVGLSQYGAFGFAEHGRDYKQILDHYYTGTRLDQVGREQRAGAARLGRGVGRLQRRQARLRQVAQAPAQLSFSADEGGVVLRDSDGDRIAGLRRRGQGRGEAADRRRRQLSRQRWSPATRMAR